MRRGPEVSSPASVERIEIPGPVGTLEAHLAIPSRLPDNGRPGIVVAPGFPTDAGGGANSFRTFPGLVERLATDARLIALTVAFRGLSSSEGHFSLSGWRADLEAALDRIRRVPGFDGSLWLMGFGTGGAIAVSLAADQDDCIGVISFAAPADFQDWASRPRELLSHARRCGAISDPTFPGDFSHWAKELQGISTVQSAGALAEGNKKLMVLHGGNDDAVPALDARAIADAHGSAELRIIDGARHHLRHDPRAIATAIGFLDRRGRPAQLPNAP